MFVRACWPLTRLASAGTGASPGLVLPQVALQHGTAPMEPGGGGSGVGGKVGAVGAVGKTFPP